MSKSKLKIGDTFVLDWGSKSGIVTRKDTIIKIKGNIIEGKFIKTLSKYIKLKA